MLTNQLLGGNDHRPYSGPINCLPGDKAIYIFYLITSFKCMAYRLDIYIAYEIKSYLKKH